MPIWAVSSVGRHQSIVVPTERSRCAIGTDWLMTEPHPESCQPMHVLCDVDPQGSVVMTTSPLALTTILLVNSALYC